jgi:hypothetical protein
MRRGQERMPADPCASVPTSPASGPEQEHRDEQTAGGPGEADSGAVEVLNDREGRRGGGEGG